jgi:putative hydrolase of the HAD superfamily
LGLARYFACILVEGELGFGKPEQAVFNRALSALKVGPRDVWMVGDSLTFDIAPAVQLGMWAVWIDWTRRGLPDTAPCRPGATIHAFPELLRVRQAIC